MQHPLYRWAPACPSQDNKRQYDQLSSTIQRDSQAVLGEARVAIEDVRRELRAQASGTARLATIEARLSSLEGSILSTGAGGKQHAVAQVVMPERLLATMSCAKCVQDGPCERLAAGWL